MVRGLTSPMEIDIVRRVREGETPAQVARFWGIPVSRVDKVVARARDAGDRPVPRRMSANDLVDAERDYDALAVPLGRAEVELATAEELREARRAGATIPKRRRRQRSHIK